MSETKAQNWRKAYAALLALLMVVPVSFYPSRAHALDLLTRSLRLQTSQPSAVTSHFFTFDIPSSSAVGSIVFEYCSNSPLPQDPCTPPTGFTSSGFTLAGQNGETGFSIHANTTANRIILTRSPAIPTSPQTVSYTFAGVTNPSTSSTSNYVRISTHAADDGTGPVIDFGGLAFSITRTFSVGGFVPPFLIFCTGVTVAPDCASQNGNRLDLGELSNSVPRASTSQFAGATNDPLGYTVALLGTTMTSGNNIIFALPTPTASTAGASQYGINLRANSTPNVGQDPIGIGSSTPAADYNIPNNFTFRNGSLTSSGSLPTDFNTFTVTYMVNIPPGQPPGIYSTTITYIATAAF